MHGYNMKRAISACHFNISFDIVFNVRNLSIVAYQHAGYVYIDMIGGVDTICVNIMIICKHRLTVMTLMRISFVKVSMLRQRQLRWQQYKECHFMML